MTLQTPPHPLHIRLALGHRRKFQNHARIKKKLSPKDHNKAFRLIPFQILSNFDVKNISFSQRLTQCHHFEKFNRKFFNWKFLKNYESTMYFQLCINPLNCSCGCGYVWFDLTLHWSCLALAYWLCLDFSLTLLLTIQCQVL